MASTRHDAYRDAGWIVRAYLPQQDIKDGIVTIQIVEAVFGGVHLEGPAASRNKLSGILALFEAQQKKGAPLNADALDRALLLADDLPDVSVAGSLREGAGERETELAIRLGNEPLIVGDAGVDNTGSRSTGSERLSTNFNLNSPLGLGELFSGNAVHTRGSDYLRLGGTLPVGVDGWRVGANASTLSYKLISLEFVALKGKGSSDTVGLEASYPIVRARLKNLYFNAAFERKTFDNQSAGATTTRYAVAAATLGLSGNLFDNLAGGGANNASLSLTQGRVNLVGSLSGQAAGRNLDSSEKFYLGGSNGVRAYPASEGGGAAGHLLTLELRCRLAEGVSLTAFHDNGRVTVNRNNDFAGAASPKVIALRGSGLAAAWQSGSYPSLKLSWARRQGSNPNPAANGNDQDGSLKNNRFWLTASLPF